jgi:outer membrane protein OmpA-like peptidoglycan-associated protein
MKNKSGVAIWVISKMMPALAVVVLAGCSQSNNVAEYTGPIATPTVDYVESLDVYSAPHQDSFLNQLAMNYRSYAIYNARTSGYSEMGELFANKAVAAFSGEVPFPESLDNWVIENEQESFELYTAYNELMDLLKNDASYLNPELAAEAQAKFDCWLSASASGQVATAQQCRERFEKTLVALRDCQGGKIVKKESKPVEQKQVVAVVEETTTEKYYPDTRNMMLARGDAREGVIIVNNVNVPEHLIKPEPVQPLIFNQNIYGGDKTVNKTMNKKSGPEGLVVVTENNLPAQQNAVMQAPCPSCPACEKCQLCQECQDCPTCPECTQSQGCQECEKCAIEHSCEPYQIVLPEPPELPEIPQISDELVTREEFVNMMMAMRSELMAINARLDQLQAASGEKTMIKVQQIPLEPKQHVMEEVFEVRFDFNKSVIKPEYQELIQKLASATQENKNIKVSVVGHTDTMGTENYNYALGGRRAEAVQKMLIEYGIPASQIVAVSAGEQGLAVPTPDNTPNAENRRVRVVKEVHYTEDAKPAPMAVSIEEVSVQ